MTDLIRVAIVEDSQDIRVGLRALIESTSGFACVGVYDAMEPALAGIDRFTPESG